MIQILDPEEIAYKEAEVVIEVPTVLRDASLKTYRTDNDIQIKAKTAVEGFIRDTTVKLKHRPLVLCGPPGTAKTFLAVSAFRRIAPLICDRQNMEGVTTIRNYFWVRGDELRNYLTGFKTEEERFFQNHLYSASFAVIDDLDKYPSGQWAADLFGLIDSRLCNCHTINVITMNSPPPEFIEKYRGYGAPIMSRFERNGAIFIKTC
ncbi:MAG: hypothetical protein WAX69_07375 [Victivallales bacterium]